MCDCLSGLAASSAALRRLDPSISRFTFATSSRRRAHSRELASALSRLDEISVACRRLAVSISRFSFATSSCNRAHSRELSLLDESSVLDERHRRPDQPLGGWARPSFLVAIRNAVKRVEPGGGGVGDGFGDGFGDRFRVEVDPPSTSFSWKTS